jgi:hypothetical protein
MSFRVRNMMAETAQLLREVGCAIVTNFEEE